jgi:hypothetical protein
MMKGELVMRRRDMLKLAASAAAMMAAPHIAMA